ncbi:MAG TPA: hypothetical protein VNJ08_01200 [Bacteriovoracaceae bacterium]|nr:hypothetical protein [Bacteriovoracaceae bacterium]
MKLFFSMLLILSFKSAFAEHAPIKHSIDPTCQNQVAREVIERTTDVYGELYQVLTPGLYVEIYAKLESFPTISLSKSVLTIKRRSTGAKFEVYYSGRSGSVGLAANGQPIHRCNVAVEQISQAQYEALGTPAR